MTDGHDPVDLPDPRLDPVIEVLLAYNRELVSGVEPTHYDPDRVPEPHTFGYWAERFIVAVHESDTAMAGDEASQEREAELDEPDPEPAGISHEPHPAKRAPRG